VRLKGQTGSVHLRKANVEGENLLLKSRKMKRCRYTAMSPEMSVLSEGKINVAEEGFFMRL
jgi:hypothetical protein